MRAAKALLTISLLFVFEVCACKSANQARQFTVMPAAVQGEIIEYGGLSGVSSLPAAMANVLSQVHQACGEKPTVGQVFRVKGSSNTAGVFFSVVDHAQANRALAGMVIAAQTGPSTYEAGLVSDSAERFAQTVNPMLQQLFGAWNPGNGGAAAGGAAGNTGAGGGTGQASAAGAPLHTVSAPDNSATISVPAGWTVDPSSNMGQLVVRGTNGEQMGLELSKGAVDPTNAWQRRTAASGYHLVLPGSVLYAFRGDPVKEFVPMLEAWRQSNGQPQAQIDVKEVKPMQASQGNHCAAGSGQINPDGKGMQNFSGEVCASDPNPQYGNYAMSLSLTQTPLSLGDTEKALINAILNSYRPNMQVINAGVNRTLQAKAQADQQTLAAAQATVNHIKQIGAQATARFNATEAANDAQHAGYWAQQDTNARTGAGFSNYLLDQTVVQNNNVGGTGAAGHATVWNSTANAMVKANPQKYEIVDTPGYWKGVDY